MALSEGLPLALKFVLPAPVHCVRPGKRAPTVALGTTRLQGPPARTVSLALPVFAGTVATAASKPAAAVPVTVNVGALTAAPIAAV